MTLDDQIIVKYDYSKIDSGSSILSHMQSSVVDRLID